MKYIESNLLMKYYDVCHLQLNIFTHAKNLFITYDQEYFVI